MTRRDFDQRRAPETRAEDSDLMTPISVGDAFDGPRPLDAGARGHMEPLFGADFSQVRVHQESDEARSRGVHAFTEGEDIHFGPEKYKPATEDGAFLLGHELAHVVQQRNGGITAQAKASETGIDASPLELEADRAGTLAARGEIVGPVEGAAPPGAAQFFSGEEHKRMGDAATDNEELKEFTDGRFKLSFGDMVLLAGDMFESPDQIRDLAATKEGQLEIQWAIWYSRDRWTKGPEPNVPQDVKDRVLDRYFKLAGSNVSHFSAGGTAEQTYAGMHKQAAYLAYLGEYELDFLAKDQAVTHEAFAQHHLSDMFSAGHVRTPRQEIIASEESEEVPSNERILSYLASRLYHYLQLLGDLPWEAEIPALGEPFATFDIVKEIKALAGSAIDEASLASILSKAQHDADNEGLNVISQRDEKGRSGDHEWRATGDGHVVDNEKITDPKTFNMAVAAMKVSRAEIDMAASLGEQHRSDGTDLFYGRGDAPDIIASTVGLGRAEEFIPREGQNNPDMKWEQNDDGSWDKRMADAIDEAFRSEIIPKIKGLVPQDMVKKVYNDKSCKLIPQEDEDPCDVEYTLRIGVAMAMVAEEIAGSPPHDWLRRALNASVDVDGPVPVPAGVPQEGPIVDAGAGSQ